MSSRLIPLDQAQAGMVLAEAVRLADGSVLLPAGSTLGDAQLTGLARRGIAEITIAPPALSAEEMKAREETVRTAVRRLFRRSETDEITRALFTAVLEFRLEKMK